MSGQVQSLTQQLAHHLVRPVELEDLDRGRLHLLDWLACVVAGSKGFPRMRQLEPLQKAPFFASNLEMDDVHRGGRLHPGPVIWSALIANPALKDHRMATLLAAGVRGYEAMIAVGETFDDYHYAHWHPTATAGVFGAVAALLLRNDEPHLRFGSDKVRMLLEAAFGHAGSVAGGVWRTRHEPGTGTKQFHIAHAIRTAEFACLVASEASLGPRFILEGEQGIFDAMCQQPRPDRLLQPESRWRIHDTSFKPWPACRHAHPAIDAALMLRECGVLQPEGPEILVETYQDAVAFCDKPLPTTDGEMRFSIQHAVAAAIVSGPDMSPGDFAGYSAHCDQLTASIRQRVKLVAKNEFTARYPAHFGARVSVGDRSAEVMDALGDPERPMSRDAIIAKARMLFDHADLSKRDAEHVIGLVVNLPLDATPMGAMELRHVLQRWLT